MTQNPIRSAPAVREARQEVRWSVCQNCEDGAEWGRIREALDAYALTVEGVVLDEVRRRVEGIPALSMAFTSDDPRFPNSTSKLLDRAAVLALLDGRDDA